MSNPKQFKVPPVIFPTGGNPSTTPSSSTTLNPSSSTTTHEIHQRRVPTPPFQATAAGGGGGIPFMAFDMGSAASSTSSTTYRPHLRPTSSSDGGGLFSDEPSLLEELEINPTLIYRKTLSLLNPFRTNPALHSDPDLSGPFLYYIAFGLFQLLNGKVQFGIILGWIAISSIFLYSILNFLAGKNGNLDLYRCFSVVGYCLMPIVMYSAASLFLPPTGSTAGFVIAALFVIWATRVCSRLLAQDSLGLSQHRALIAYPCFLIYTLFSLLVIF